jgi:hypothetical protein
MALITFPRTLPSELRSISVEFELVPMMELNRTRGARQITTNLGPDIWVMSVVSKPMRPRAFNAVRAWYHTLMSEESFLAWDQTRQRPVSYTRAQFEALTFGGSTWDRTGTLVTVASNNLEVTLTDLPVSFRLLAGDLMSFTYGGVQALHEVSATATADAGSPGDLTVEVRPRVRPGWSAGAAVLFNRPVAEMKVEPGSWRASADPLGSASFRAVQTL